MPELITSEDLLLKGLLVAQAGAGKTCLLATAADVEEMSPACVIDFEGGTLSIAHRKDLYRERVRSTAQLQEVFWKIANDDKDFKGIKTYFIDSGSEFADLALEEVASAAYQDAQRNPERAKRASIDDVQLKDYGTSTKRVRRLFRWFKELEGKNILISALPQFRYPQPPANATEGQKRQFDDNIRRGLIKPVQIVPAFTEKLGNAVCGFTDFNWYLNVVEKEGKQVRQLITQRSGPLHFIKTRGPKLAEKLGVGKEVELIDGKPCIEGKPAMKYVYDLYKENL